MPRWTSGEVLDACRAYRAASENSIRGADQRYEDFEKEYGEKLFAIMPPGLDANEGTHCHHFFVQ